MSIKEDVAAIKQQLLDMDKRQDNWFKLLQGRIPAWDESKIHTEFLMKGFWLLATGLVGSILSSVAIYLRHK